VAPPAPKIAPLPKPQRPQPAKPQNRSGGTAGGSFAQLHPRGRGGKWIAKPGDGYGSQGPSQTTAQLQQRLNQLGFKVPVDGQYGQQTAAAVHQFQQRYGLSSKFGVDAATQAFLQNPPAQTIGQIQRAKGVSASTRKGSRAATPAQAAANKTVAGNVQAAVAQGQIAAAETKQAGHDTNVAAAQHDAAQAQTAANRAEKLAKEAKATAAGGSAQAQKNAISAQHTAQTAEKNAKAAAKAVKALKVQLAKAEAARIKRAQGPLPGEVAVLATGPVHIHHGGGGGKMRLTPPTKARTPKTPKKYTSKKVQVATSAELPKIRPNLEEAEGFAERLHPRGRGGKFVDVLAKLEHEPTGPKLVTTKPETVKREMEAPKPLLPGDKPTMFESKVCSKCGGEGKIWTYSNVMGGVCFKCQGRGRTLTPRGQKANGYYKGLLSTPANELKPGDKIWDAGVTGFTQPGWKEVTSATPNKDGTVNVNASGGGLVNSPPDKMFRTQHTAAEKQAASVEAKAYQATLTKTGKATKQTTAMTDEVPPPPQPKPPPKPKAPPKPKIVKPPPGATSKQVDLIHSLAQKHGTDVHDRINEIVPGLGYHGTEGDRQKLLNAGAGGDLTRKQASGVIDEFINKAAPGEPPKANAPVVEGDKVDVAGHVVSARYKDTPYGTQAKVLIQDDRGFRVYGTLPSKLEDELSNRSQATSDTWASYLQKHPLRIKLTGGVKKSPGDENYGFFSRPKNASFVDEEQKMQESEDQPEPDVEEGTWPGGNGTDNTTTVAFGYGGDYSMSIPDGRDTVPLADRPTWTRSGVNLDKPDYTIQDGRPDLPGVPLNMMIPDGRTVQDMLSVRLTEAVAARKAATNSQEFTRALARERVLRARLDEGLWDTAKHPRGRGGKWIEVMNKLMGGSGAPSRLHVRHLEDMGDDYLNARLHPDSDATESERKTIRAIQARRKSQVAARVRALPTGMTSAARPLSQAQRPLSQVQRPLSQVQKPLSKIQRPPTQRSLSQIQRPLY
jgi:peptidoglycan hydrolase-like protein with peptidoglycan-binding domain